MAYQHLLVDLDGPIGRITLNRPDERNAMSPEMGHELRRAVREINYTPSVRVVVVRGAGQAFSAGGNLANLEAEAQAGGQATEGGLGGGASFYRLYLSIRDLDVPSIAAINGHAIGAGLCFAVAHDLRVVHERAKLGMTFVRLGLHPGMAATWTLPRLVGATRAAELLYTGRLISGREAFEMGLANRVAGDDFDWVVEDLAQGVATSGPVAVRALKRTLRGTLERTIDEAVDAEAKEQAMTFRTEDVKEGLRALREKRDPRFEGR